MGFFFHENSPQNWFSWSCLHSNKSMLLVACMSNTAGFTLAPSSGFSQLSFESGSHAHMDNETVLVHTEKILPNMLLM